MKDFVISFLIFLSLSLHAEKKVAEQVFMHTDKECYLAGEEIWLKFYVVDQNINPSFLSKVGYVEISDTQKPQLQIKLALSNGCGAGKISVPSNLPSGTYLLTGYTRYMRNEGKSSFFEKQIAIINLGTRSGSSERIEWKEQDKSEITIKIKENDTTNYIPVNVEVLTDKKEYSNRAPVKLTLNHLPNNIADMVVSVYREDSLLISPDNQTPAWKKISTEPSPQQWLPEWEGHIITGHTIPQAVEGELLPSIAFVGKDIRYISGQLQQDNQTALFYTTELYGSQEIVTSIVSKSFEKTPYRVDISSPFYEICADSLPLLKINLNDKSLMERYIGIQLQKNIATDTFAIPESTQDYYHLQVTRSYDLDNYTRFNTLTETFVEFVDQIRVIKVDGKSKLRVYSEEKKRFNNSVLVLLDGVPIYDYENFLEYNPRHIKFINIYDGEHTFGKEYFECIVSFITYSGNLPSFQLSGESQLFTYECPALPVQFENFDHSHLTLKNARTPDFRHTLYWNPFVELIPGQPIHLSFYTSDLEGKFNIRVEGFTKDGKQILGISNLEVK